MEYFNIQLDKPATVYAPGDTIAGHLKYKVHERFKIKELLVAAIGEANVRWTESTTDSEGNPDHYVYSCLEKYYSLENVYETGSGNLYLEQGEYSRPFQFTLPTNIPSSFEHSTGRIRHKIVGTVKMPWWSKNKTCRKLVTVVRPIDLNQIAILREPCQVTETVRFGVLCCKSDPVKISLAVKQGGFVSGQKIDCDVQIDNQSFKRLNNPAVVLYETDIFQTSSKSNSFLRTVCTIVLPRQIEPNSVEVFKGVELLIPPVCPSSTIATAIIQVRYHLQLDVSTSGFSSKKCLQLPVTIGTVPIGSQVFSNHYSFRPAFFGGSSGEKDDSDSYTPTYPYLRDISS